MGASLTEARVARNAVRGVPRTRIDRTRQPVTGVRRTSDK